MVSSPQRPYPQLCQVLLELSPVLSTLYGTLDHEVCQVHTHGSRQCRWCVLWREGRTDGQASKQTSKQPSKPIKQAQGHRGTQKHTETSCQSASGTTRSPAVHSSPHLRTWCCRCLQCRSRSHCGRPGGRLSGQACQPSSSARTAASAVGATGWRVASELATVAWEGRAARARADNSKSKSKSRQQQQQQQHNAYMLTQQHFIVLALS